MFPNALYCLFFFSFNALRISEENVQATSSNRKDLPRVTWSYSVT